MGDGHFGTRSIGVTGVIQPSSGLVTALRVRNVRDESSQGCVISLSLKHQLWGGFFWDSQLPSPQQRTQRVSQPGGWEQIPGAPPAPAAAPAPPGADNADKEGAQGALVLVPAQIAVTGGACET